jgi:hypothetical protein
MVVTIIMLPAKIYVLDVAPSYANNVFNPNLMTLRVIVHHVNRKTQIHLIAFAGKW